jgi:hypothetical protein
MNTNDRALLDAVLRNDLMAFTQRCFQTVVAFGEARHVASSSRCRPVT